MAISDIKKYFTLTYEWNMLIDCQSNMTVFANMALSKINILTSDQNYLLNASAEEIQFINNFTSFINNFINTMPINPNR